VLRSSQKPFGGRGSDTDRSTHISEDAVREELSRVLTSNEFRASKRSQDFLRYVVEHTLTGRTDALKERTIGIEVFGRPTSYDPSDDATVRVKAGEVRKRLSLYYANLGIHDLIRIELPGGTYVPEFRQVEQPPEPVLELSAVREPPPSVPRAQRRRFVWLVPIAVVAAALIAGGYFWYHARPHNHALDEFWSPVLQGTSSVSVCASYVPVYNLDRDPSVKTPARGDDFTLLTDQFVGGGDLVAVSRLSSMLTRLKRPYQVRIGSEISFRDLRSAPAILVGFAYTRWKEISSEMRYFIDGSRRPVVITDNGKPTPWALPNLPADRHTTEDYAIVSRVFHPDTHAMLVEVAGITQYGTDAASDLITNPDLLADALRGAPSGWQHKNLQLVLHVKVVSGAPSSPRVVATYFW
jgi:hypothetical protein